MATLDELLAMPPAEGSNVLRDALRQPFTAGQQQPLVAEPLGAPARRATPAAAVSPVYNVDDLMRMGAGQHGPLYAIDYTAPVAQVRAAIARLPENMREDAMRIWADTYVANEAQNSSGVDDRVRAVSRGTLIGSFLDEANAATQGALHSVTGGFAGAPYDETLAYNRARDRRFDRSNPLESTALQIGGGVASAVPFLAAPASVGQAVGRGVAYGTGAGAVHGFGEGEGGFGNRVDNAVSGAGYGAMFGLGAPLAVAGATRGAGIVRDAISPTIARWRQGPDAAAEQILARQMTRAGTSPPQIADDLQRGRDAAVMHGGGNAVSRAPLPEAIADTSDAMRRLTGTVYRAGGEAGDFTRNALEARQRGPANPYAPQPGEPAGQAANVLETIERALQIRSAESARRAEARIRTEMRAEGNRLYEAARQNQTPFDLGNVLQGFSLRMAEYPPSFARMMQRAMNLFSEANPAGARFPVTRLERFDPAKRALDDMISAAERNGQRELMRELVMFKNALDDAVFGIRYTDGVAGPITQNQAYRQARDAWGNRQRDIEALDMGRRALREDSDVSVAAFNELTPRQQQLFRVGFLEQARNSLGPRRSGDDATRTFTTLRAQELMNAIIPRPRASGAVFADRPARFGEVLSRQNRMTQTRNQALGGSPTAQRLNDDATMIGDTLSTMYNRFRQSPSLMNLGFEAIASVMQRVFAYRQDVALAMARRLLTTDPDEQSRILVAIAMRARDRDSLSQFAALLDRMAIATGMSAAGAATGAR